MKRRLLDDAHNVFGHLKPETRERITRYLDDPSAENWSDINGIIIQEPEIGRCYVCGGRPGGGFSGMRTHFDLHHEGRSHIPPRTIWQAVVALDPSFTDIGLPVPRGFCGPHEKRWRKWPDAVLVARAIKAALGTATRFY